MKRTIHFLSVAVIVAAVSVANAYIYEGFNTVPGTPSGWGNSSGVYNTNSLKMSGDGSLYVPVLQTVSNQTICGAGQKVWTDFYTIPRPFQSDTETAPAVDPTATAQFFVDVNGLWVTISGDGGSGCVTNTLTEVLGVSGEYPTVTQNNVFYHIGVLHDYTVSPARWSLFVNDLCLRTNLIAIATDVTAHQWFQVQNYGGNVSNVCYLDEFLVTNKAATGVGSTNYVPGTVLSQASALNNFNSFADPRPSNDTVSAASEGIVMTFDNVVNDGRKYIVFGTTDPLLNSLASNGLVNAVSGVYSNNALAGSATRYFYEMITLSSNGEASVTNSEVFACYKQSRAQQKSYRFGVPVNYLDNANDRTMGGAMGEQLKTGLGVGDVLTIVEGANTYKYRLINAGGLQWDCFLGDDGDGTNQWGEGIGFNIARTNTGSSTSSTIFAGLKPTSTTVSVALADGWSYLSWPYNDSSTGGQIPGLTGGASPSQGDTLYIQQNPSDTYVPARYNSGAWKYGLNGAGMAITNRLRAGDGIIYKGNHAGKTWVPVVVP